MPVLIGIDYGSKRVGVALSDERGAVAFPRTTYPNNHKLIPTLAELIQEKKVTAAVVGDSRNMKGEENPIAADIKQFAAHLKAKTAIPVHFEPEFYTSVEARRTTGKSVVDAESAAIILNSYITRTAS